MLLYRCSQQILVPLRDYNTQAGVLAYMEQL